MKLVIFGLTITSSWGNGHATIWRGLAGALARRGRHILFFERDVPYYAIHRDLWSLAGLEIRLYQNWDEIVGSAREELADADAAIVTSYCPDGISASELVQNSPAAVRVFYDLDTPVTLEGLRLGDAPAYLDPRGLGGFDLVLSYTGGRALLVDLALWMLDFPRVENVSSRLFASGGRFVPGDGCVEDYAVASLELESGVHARISCSWRAHMGCDAEIHAAVRGTKGGAQLRNVNGSFFDFVTERFQGTHAETLRPAAAPGQPPEPWSERAILDWVRRLSLSNRFDAGIESQFAVAEVLDRIREG